MIQSRKVKRRMSRKNISSKKTKKSFKKLRKTKTQKRNKHIRRRHKHSYNNQKGGGILPSSVSQLGYSIMGTGQSIVDGWNGKSSSFSYVNPSPESQMPVNGIYQANHNII